MEQFSYYRDQVKEIGIVTHCVYPLAFAKGLPNARIGEIVHFSSGQMGQEILIYRYSIDIILMYPNTVRF